MRFYSILGTVLGARDAEVTGTHLGARGLLVSVSLKSWPSARCSGRSGAQLQGAPFTLQLVEIIPPPSGGMAGMVLPV